MKPILLPLISLPLLLVGCQDADVATSNNQVDEPIVEAVVESELETPILIDSAHSARNALDWHGLYSGTLPCADCSGIDVTLTLNVDNTYHLTETYRGEEDHSFKSDGPFSWNEAGSVVTLDNKSTPNQFFVAEGRLIKLDINGEQITGDLSERYNLAKQ
ncbi:copper resistance protein NlpE [Vibrio astriarenae]|jgi:uncharacterized lipoprotein NlpE involved in copper resistance